TPQGSARSRAALRQPLRIGQDAHSAFASSSCAGFSANHRSGFPTRQGRVSETPRVRVVEATDVRHVTRVTVAVDTFAPSARAAVVCSCETGAGGRRADKTMATVSLCA